MRMKLFEVILYRDSGTTTHHAVCRNREDVVAMVSDTEAVHQRSWTNLTVRRVDKIMPKALRRGLDAVLTGPAGFARFVGPTGWVLDQVLDGELMLFRIFTPEGKETFVVAVEDHEAAAIYMDSRPLEEGESELFKIVDALPDLTPEQLDGVGALLDAGERGVVTWVPREGWKSAS